MINSHLILTLFLTCLGCLTFLVGCGNANVNTGSSVATASETSAVAPDSVESPTQPQPGDSAYHFVDKQAILDYISNGPNASKYSGGIIPVIAEHVPDYADRLIAALSKYSGFIVVDKASMRVILYDRYGHVDKSYGMACARNYGTKHKKADSRTPEGFFSVAGVYDSTDWLYTNDDGYTSPAKGQFGPRFIRIKIPNTSQIGIHGTSAPWSIGHRASHGCIRLTNENIMELHKLVTVGMPVIVLPGKRDRAVNRQEGYDIPFFPTGEDYEMSEAEKKEKVNPDKKDFSEPKDSLKVSGDSVVAPAAKPAVEPSVEPVPDVAPNDSVI